MAEVEISIDFLRIKKKSLHKLFGKNNLKTLKNLADLQSFCYDPAHTRKYNKHLKSFRIGAPLEKVWETYKTISPQETWNGKWFRLEPCTHGKATNFPFMTILIQELNQDS